MLVGLLTGLVLAQQLSPEMARLGQIRKRMADNLASLPDYTCTQTFERVIRGPDDKVQFRDRVRLAVAFIGGQELFAWPESGKFEHRPLDEYVQTGSISTGNFAVHVFNLFRSSGPVITYSRDEEIGGRRAHRYDFRVPLLSSNSTLRVRGREGRVAHRGSFWVDAGTLDLLRIEIHADEIPPDLGCARASDVLEYGRGRLGETDYLLPRATEAVMVDRAGYLSRNLI